MARRQEICRDFQRGSCRYGPRCKFLHQANYQQQQRQPQQNQNQRNDFGGGGGSNYYGVLANNYSQRPSQNNQSQQAAKEHRCNDPRVCKDQIKEDFQNEHPVFWRLTCYAHYKHLPNDIVGDVSPEELRAHAYEGGKQGLSLRDVAQREASMVAAKNAEFEALLRNPYKGPASQSSAAPFPSFSASPGSQDNSTVMVFGQPLTLSNPTPVGLQFGRTADHFGGTAATGFSFGQASGDFAFGSRPSNVNGSSFGSQQTNVFQQSPFTNTVSPGALPNAFQQSPFISTASPEPSVFQQSSFASSASPGSVAAPVANGNVSPFGLNSPSPGFSSNPGPTISFATSPGNSVASRATPTSSLSNTAVANICTNGEEDAKWYTDVWKIGEIPEGEPPVQLRF